MRQRRYKQRLLREAVKAARKMVKLWGPDLGIGVDLSCRHFGDNPWATVRELAQPMHLSEDSVRRKLDELENIGRVISKAEGRSRHYRAVPAYAERSYQIVSHLCSAANCDD